MKALLKKIRQCEVCINELPFGCNPIIQIGSSSKIMIIGQAPGKRVHETSIPWNDKSGDTLRQWMGVDKETFYDPTFFSLMPMGFCYPGKGTSGDLPPRKECAPLWHSKILEKFKEPPLILLIGQYAQKYYLKKDFDRGLTSTVKNYNKFLPHYFPLPHPSPRNQYWLKVNPWFIQKTIPELRKLISERIR